MGKRSAPADRSREKATVPPIPKRMPKGRANAAAQRFLNSAGSTGGTGASSSGGGMVLVCPCCDGSSRERPWPMLRNAPDGLLCQACKGWKGTNMRWVADEVFARLVRTDEDLKSAVAKAMNDKTAGDGERDFQASDVCDAVRFGVKVKRSAFAVDGAEVFAVTGRPAKQLKLPVVNIPDEQGGRKTEAVYVVANEAKPFREIELYVNHEVAMSSMVLVGDTQSFAKQAAFALQHTVSKIQEDENSKALFGKLRSFTELQDGGGGGTPRSAASGLNRSKSGALDAEGEVDASLGGDATIGRAMPAASGVVGAGLSAPGTPCTSRHVGAFGGSPPAASLAIGAEDLTAAEVRSESGKFDGNDGSTLAGDDEGDLGVDADDIDGPMALAQRWIAKMPLPAVLAGHKTGKAEYQAKVLIEKWSAASPAQNKVECGMLTSHLSLVAVCHALRSPAKVLALPAATLREYLTKLVMANVRMPLALQTALVSRACAHIVSAEGSVGTADRVEQFLKIIVPWAEAEEGGSVPKTVFDPLDPKNSLIASTDNTKCENFINVVFKELVVTTMYEGEPKANSLLDFCKHSVDVFEVEMSPDLEREVLASTYTEALAAMRCLIVLLDEQVIDEAMLKETMDTINAGLQTGLQAAKSIKSFVGNSLHNVPFYKAKVDTFVKFESRTKKHWQRASALLSQLSAERWDKRDDKLGVLAELCDSMPELCVSFRAGFVSKINSSLMARIKEVFSGVESSTADNALREKVSLDSLLALLSKAIHVFPLEDELVMWRNAVSGMIRQSNLASKASRLHEAAVAFVEATTLAKGSSAVEELFTAVDDGLGIVVAGGPTWHMEAVLDKMLEGMHADLKEPEPLLDWPKFQEMATKVLSFVPDTAKTLFAPHFDLVGKVMLLATEFHKLNSLGASAEEIAAADVKCQQCVAVLRAIDVVAKAFPACAPETSNAKTPPEVIGTMVELKKTAEKLTNDVGSTLLLATYADMEKHLEELRRVAAGGADGASWSEGLREGVDDKDWTSFNNFCIETLAKTNASVIKVKVDGVKWDLDRAKELRGVFCLPPDNGMEERAVKLCARGRITIAEGVLMGLFNSGRDKTKLKTLCMKEKATWLGGVANAEADMNAMIADRLKQALRCR